MAIKRTVEIETDESLFDRLYNDSKLVDKLKMPFVKRDIKNQFKDVYNKSQKLKDESEKKIFEIQSNPIDFNVESIVDAHTKILRATEVQEIIKKEFREYFDEDFKE